MVSNKNDLYTQTVINNMIETFTLMIKSARDKNAEVNNIGESIRYYSGSDFFIFNGLFSHIDILENPRHYFSEMMDYFTYRKKPFTWWWTAQTPIPHIIQNELNHFKFVFLGNYLGMTIELNSANLIPTPKEISVREVSSENEYEDFINIIAEVFQFSPSIKLDYSAMCQSYGKKGYLKHYLGYYNQKPVSTLTTYANQDVVGFYNGATLTRMQKHGINTALAQHVLLDAKKCGMKIGISQLMAPGMAKGISEKMGAKTTCVLLPFVNKL